MLIKKYAITQAVRDEGDADQDKGPGWPGAPSHSADGSSRAVPRHMLISRIEVRGVKLPPGLKLPAGVKLAPSKP